MVQGEDQNEHDQPKISGLDSYHRLIELQKQMIALSNQYEKAKRECDALRDEVAREVAGQIRARKGLRHRLRQSAVRYLGLFRASPAFGLVNRNRDTEPPSPANT